MPKQTQQVSLKQLLGPLAGQAVKSTAAHKGDETVISASGELPSGIELGVARLNAVQFGKYKSGKNEGKPFFRADAIVLEPKEVNGIPIEGLRTQIGPEPLCDTPDSQGKKKTFDDHWSFMLNELRKLGLDTKTIGDDPDALQTACKALEQAKPYIRFRTWGGDEWTNSAGEKVKGQVNHEWKGTCKYNGQVVNSVVDSSPPADRSEPEPEASAPEPEESAVQTEDTSELASLADTGDEAAARRLSELAEAAGVPKDQVENADSWSSVADMISVANGLGEEQSKPASENLAALGTAADEGDQGAIDRLNDLGVAAGLNVDEIDSWSEVAAQLQAGGGAPAPKPNKGDIRMFRPPKARKDHEVEVTAVFTDKCNVKELDTGKSHKGVPFDKLTMPA